jgi:hypothetical protein
MHGARLGVFTTSLVVGLIASCGSDDGGAGGEGTGGSGGTGFNLDGGGGPACQSAADCASGQVCHPYSRDCVTPGSACAEQSDCAAGNYCDSDSGVCLPGTTGSPCETDANCAAASCSGGACGCSGLAHEQELVSGPLDIYFIFDRTSSMGEDCAYQAGGTPPANSKACFATYAFPNYLINVTPQVDTRLAFQFMSLANNDCDGALYATPLVDLTTLPVAANHAIVQAISNENFAGGFGTHIEGALRGIADYTANNRTVGREMIGVLMTDGDPNGCEDDLATLRGIIADHLAATGIRTFIIGMEGATDANLEELGTAGGAQPHSDWCGSVGPPCHYWNVEDGSGDAIASALRAIIGQAAPLPCQYNVAGLTPPEGETLDYGRVNVALTDPGGVPTTIGQVGDEAGCPTNQPAWYYDNPSAPTTINLCPNACDLATTAANGSRVQVVVGCQDTVVVE